MPRNQTATSYIPVHRSTAQNSGQVCGVDFVDLTQDRSIWEEETSMEKILPSYLPVRKLVGGIATINDCLEGLRSLWTVSPLDRWFWVVWKSWAILREQAIRQCFSVIRELSALSSCPSFPQWCTITYKPNKLFPRPCWLWSLFFHRCRNQTKTANYRVSIGAHWQMNR